jgi:hypothetical protein
VGVGVEVVLDRGGAAAKKFGREVASWELDDRPAYNVGSCANQTLDMSLLYASAEAAEQRAACAAPRSPAAGGR